MPSQRKPQADRHKNPPLRVRLPEGDRAWVLETAEAAGRPVNSLIAEAVSQYRAWLADDGMSPGRRHAELEAIRALCRDSTDDPDLRADLSRDTEKENES